MTTPTTIDAELHRIERYHKRDMAAVVTMLKSEKRSGALTLHFSSGEICVLEWKGKEKTFDRKGVLCSKVELSQP